MGHVGGRVGEAHLQLPGHLLRLDEVHQVLTCGLCPGQHVKIFTLLHAGEGRAHHVPGEVSAAAHGDDARVQGLFHNGADGVLLQVVELDGLAGGEVGPGHVILPDGLGGERQLFLRHPAGGHPQAQHTGLSALLGVAAVQAGKALIGGLVQLSGVKRGGPGLKFRQVLLPALSIDLMHGGFLPVFQQSILYDRSLPHLHDFAQPTLHKNCGFGIFSGLFPGADREDALLFL